MQVDVLIVLNEREPAKERIAEQLEDRLAGQNITTSRIAVSKNLAQTIAEREPRVLVVDYLLGDVTTGLDLVESLKHLTIDLPQILFLTDEPSVAVAVQALKLGARDYISTEVSGAIQNTVSQIRSLLHDYPKSQSRSVYQSISIDRLICQSHSYIELVDQLRRIVKSKAPIVLLGGPAGVGRSTVGQALATAMTPNMLIRTSSLFNYSKSISELSGLGQRGAMVRLGDSMSLVVDQVEYDTGEFIDHILENFFNKSRRSDAGVLIVCSSELAALEAWRRECKEAPLIQVPSLSVRSEDIAPLVLHFQRSAAESIGHKFKGFDGQLLVWLASIDWPGELRQLKAAIFEAECSHERNAEILKSLIETNRKRFSDQQSCFERQQAVEPLVVVRALEQFNWNERIAAASLGISILELRAKIRSQQVNGQRTHA